MKINRTRASQPNGIAAFRDRPIKQKLLVVTVLTTAAALLLTGIVIFASDTVLSRENLQRDLAVLAQITADDSTAAVAFDDPETAEETLAALRARTHIVSACIYRSDGSLLARYLRPRSASVCPPANAPSEDKFFGSSLTVSRPILLQDRRIGTFVMRYDLGEIYQRMRIYGGIIIIVLLVSSVLSFALSSQLRGIISTPILQLAQTTSAVAESRDYSLRARRLSGDELGALVDRFNEMLAGIQSRDNELRNTLLQLQQSNEELGRSNEDLERFAFVASHDLQEPLRMISVYSQLLTKNAAGKLDGELNRFVEQILESAKRMRELLADLLAYTQTGARTDAPAQPIDLNLVLEKVQNNLRIAIDGCGAAINADALPTISAHESHMISLFQNLIGNALKYRSERPPRVRVCVQHMDHHHRFAVIDNGIGIAPEYHDKIFIAFKRLHGKSIPGTGIGLAICQRVVQLYGGRIWVESETGKGATFLFTLPDGAHS